MAVFVKGGQQHVSTTKDCAFTVSHHSVHLRLPIQLRVLSSPEILNDPAVMGVSVMDKRLSTGSSQLVSPFVVWCGNNHLILDTNKTKDCGRMIRGF